MKIQLLEIGDGTCLQCLDIRNVRGRYPEGAAPLKPENLYASGTFTGDPPVLRIRLDDANAPDFWLEFEVHGLSKQS